MNGALLLGLISLVCVTDVVIAFFFLRSASQADSVVGAAPKAGPFDARARQRAARMMLITAPLMWLIVALLSFGIIPAGNIVPIKF